MGAEKFGEVPFNVGGEEPIAGQVDPGNEGSVPQAAPTTPETASQTGNMALAGAAAEHTDYVSPSPDIEAIPADAVTSGTSGKREDTIKTGRQGQ
jgi:hypothetical protein